MEVGPALQLFLKAAWQSTHISHARPPLPSGEILKPGAKHAPLPADAGEASIARLDKLRNASGNLRTAEVRRSMQKIMQNNAAVFRTQVWMCGHVEEKMCG